MSNFDDFWEYGQLVFNTLIFLERYLYLNITNSLRKGININFLKDYFTQSLYRRMAAKTTLFRKWYLSILCSVV